MAVHVWVDGEAITASKLNALERKKAFINGELPFTKLTYNEAVALIEETGTPYFSYHEEAGEPYMVFNKINSMITGFGASTSDSLLQFTGSYGGEK